MQRAEGPEAFENGYLAMTRLYSEDAHKLKYIEELFADEAKAHFKSNLPFTNGVLVDMCEVLFNATKVWVFGNARTKRVSLLLAVVRIISGCYNMIMVAFVTPVTQARKKNKSKNKYVSSLFATFAEKLTARACKDMFDSLERAWTAYTIRSEMNNSCRLISTFGDVFVVKADFQCSCENTGRPCWQQKHTGLLCGHALRACVHRLKNSQSPERRETIISHAVSGCDNNWLRSTYSTAGAPTGFCQPIPTFYGPTTLARSRIRQEYMHRFNVVARFMSPDMLEEHLHAMELAVLQLQSPADGDDSDGSSEGASDEDDSVSVPSSSSSVSPREPELLVVSNPSRSPSKKSQRKNYKRKHYNK